MSSGTLPVNGAQMWNTLTLEIRNSNSLIAFWTSVIIVSQRKQRSQSVSFLHQ